MAPVDGYRPGHDQGVVRPGTLVQVHRQRTNERVYRFAREDWGEELQLGGRGGGPNEHNLHLARSMREVRAIAIDPDSEASSVWVHPHGRLDETTAVAVSNRAPWIGLLEGPIYVSTRDGIPSGLDTDLLHTLKLVLYPHYPGWLPDKRADRYYYWRELSFDSGESNEETILEKWFRGREGLMIMIHAYAPFSGEHTYRVYAGVNHENTGVDYDEIGTGVLTAAGDTIIHWEGRADAIKMTMETTSNGTACLAVTMQFRDEF